MRRYTNRQSREGYLLLSVMAFLIIAQLLLVSLARRSYLLATRALQSQKELQRRWGSVSLQRTLLPLAKLTFEAWDEAHKDDKLTQRQPPRFVYSVILSGQQYDVRLDDEDAKINLNYIYHLRGRAQVVRAVRVSLLNQRALSIRPRPQGLPQALKQDQLLRDDGDDDGTTALPVAFPSWGHVFELGISDYGKRRQLPAAATNLTCFSEGPLNIRHAPDANVIELCRCVMPAGAAQRLVKNYRDNSHLGLARTIERSGIQAKQQSLAKLLLTEQSACYSLWIAVRSDQKPVWQQLIVAQRVEDGMFRTSQFSF